MNYAEIKKTIDKNIAKRFEIIKRKKIKVGDTVHSKHLKLTGIVDTITKGGKFKIKPLGQQDRGAHTRTWNDTNIYNPQTFEKA